MTIAINCKMEKPFLFFYSRVYFLFNKSVSKTKSGLTVLIFHNVKSREIFQKCEKLCFVSPTKWNVINDT